VHEAGAVPEMSACLTHFAGRLRVMEQILETTADSQLNSWSMS
jgi:hypothetical protein